MHHLGPAFVLPSILVFLWLLPSPYILSALWQSKLSSFKDIRPIETVIAPRGRGSRRGNSRSEENRLLRPLSPPPFTSLPLYTEEQELDKRLTAFETTTRFQRKRYRIEVLERNEDLDEPTDFERCSTSFRRYKSDI